MDASVSLLIGAFIDPHTVMDLDCQSWNRLLRLARRLEILPRLASGLLPFDEQLPTRVADHIHAASAVAEAFERNVRWEVDRVERALRETSGRAVLLKGAAYVVANLPVARGRRTSDLDLLVPCDSLATVEEALRQHGWEPLHNNDYDDYYYRAWMHELPPLRHRTRGTVIDVHHTILPTTGRLRPDVRHLWERARPVVGYHFYVLAPEDMVLHAMAHVFQDGELSSGLRDLLDLDSLLKYFGETEDGFWSRLVPRARQLQLMRPLFYGLHFSKVLLRTPIPDFVLKEAVSGQPTRLVRSFMERLVTLASLPCSRDEESWQVSTARLLLYIRSHWLRMPPGLLLRHLTRKASARWSLRRVSK